jgi:hypothetical protein
MSLRAKSGHAFGFMIEERRQGRFCLPSAGDSSHNGIFTTVTQGTDSSSQTGFEASFSDLDVRTLLVDVRPARGVNLKQLSEGK